MRLFFIIAVIGLLLFGFSFVIIQHTIASDSDIDVAKSILLDGKTAAQNHLNALKIYSSIVQINQNFSDPSMTKIFANSSDVPIVREDVELKEQVKSGIYCVREEDIVRQYAASIQPEDLTNPAKSKIQRTSFKDIFTPILHARRINHFLTELNIPTQWEIRKSANNHELPLFAEANSPFYLLYSNYLSINSNCNNFLNTIEKLSSTNKSDLVKVVISPDSKQVTINLLNNRYQLVLLADTPEKIVSEKMYRDGGLLHESLLVSYDSEGKPKSIKKFIFGDQSTSDESEESMLKNAITIYDVVIKDYDENAALTENDLDPYAQLKNDDIVYDSLEGVRYIVGQPSTRVSLDELNKKSQNAMPLVHPSK